jgi:hypothetical protein
MVRLKGIGEPPNPFQDVGTETGRDWPDNNEYHFRAAVATVTTATGRL